jgi:hypothetical protein
LPIVKNIKKVYTDSSESYQKNDTINISMSNDITNIIEILDAYKSSSNNTISNNQSKYSILYQDLNPSFTPFDLIDQENTENILIEKDTGCDITTVINNLEDMYSSIVNNNNVKTRRFVIQKYNLGLTRLSTIENTSTKMITTRVNMTQPDTMSIKSFLTLPEPTIRFSKINLPSTSIAERVHLNSHFLNYWQLFNKKTNVHNIFIDDLEEGDIEFDENNFVNNIKNYVLNIPDENKKGLTNIEIYTQFVKKIIPKIKILFNLVKKYVHGKLSVVDVVSYLEPFMVYADNLTYNQYKEIIHFIDSEISNYNKQYLERSKTMNIISKLNSKPLLFDNAYSIVSIITTNDNLRDETFGSYDISIEKNVEQDRYIYTNSEILRKIIIRDSGKLYNYTICKENLSLRFPNEFSNLFDDSKQELDYEIQKEKNTGFPCKNITIAKHYALLDDLNHDNNKDIYFDKKYDTTHYELLDKYENELMQMPPDKFIPFLTNELKAKQRLNEEDALYLAETLFDGVKKVKDGQYAILYKLENPQNETNNNEHFNYYVRKGNQWILDDTPDLKTSTDDTNILCNLQEKCIQTPNPTATSNDNTDCETIKMNELTIKNQLLTDVLNEFDEHYNLSKIELQETINNSYHYCLATIHKLIQMENYNVMKYNNQKYKLGSLDDDKSSKIVSPNSKLLQIILSQGDFIKKQYDVIRFVNKYTRQPITDRLGPLNTVESEHWLYCTVTNTPILPVFRFNMATEFITNNNGYNDYVNLLISNIGKLSDDGHLWTDKHSGWTIIKINDDYDEGYENGFKVVSRSIMENDIGNNVTQMNNTATNQYNTVESNTISNIVNAISVAMGIQLESQKEFIINCVLDALKNKLEQEDDYKLKIKQMAEKGKKIMSYKDLYNNSILYYTLAMILIAIQTAMPSIKTRKTHPGCVRSFVGYPFEGNGDFSSITYLCCVVYDIRDSGGPWYVLKGKKQTDITSKLKLVVDTIFLNILDVKRRFAEKTEYLLLTGAEDIPEEHSVTKWTNFLPPLIPFKINKLSNVSSDFKKMLMSEMKSGSSNQQTKLLVIQSKIILFAFAIQEKIQEMINNIFVK